MIKLVCGVCGTPIEFNSLDGIKELLESIEKDDGWISIDEEPQFHSRVILYDRFDDFMKIESNYEMRYNDLLNTYTHWKYAPNPPINK